MADRRGGVSQSKTQKYDPLMTKDGAQLGKDPAPAAHPVPWRVDSLDVSEHDVDGFVTILDASGRYVCANPIERDVAARIVLAVNESDKAKYLAEGLRSIADPEHCATLYTIEGLRARAAYILKLAGA
jgi:hypothetical protein